MKRFAVLLTFLLMLSILLSVNEASVFAANNQKVGINVHAPVYSSTLLTGGDAIIQVGFYNTELADKNGLRSADITLSYDENVFEASDDLLIYDESLNRYVWRDSAFSKQVHWVEALGNWSNENFTLTNLYPLDSDPNDGKKEIRITIVTTGNYYFNSLLLDTYLTFKLKVKEKAPLKKTAISVLPKKTVLRDSKNSVVNSFYYKSAHLSVEKPKSLSIVPSFTLPTKYSLTYHVGQGLWLMARANFSSDFVNGDFMWISGAWDGMLNGTKNNGDYKFDVGTWTSSDTSVVTVSPQFGYIKAVGVGTAWITFTSGELTTKKRIDVVENSVAIPKEKEEFYMYGYHDPYTDDQQILINGEDAGLARVIEGSLYAPLKTIATVLNANVAYDTVKKMPTLNGMPVSHFKVFGRTSYIKLSELRTIIGANLTWDKKNKLLLITI